MVRKRSRKYDSDNDSDSDVDFDVEEKSEPAPKKYSLRERKRAPLLTSFDYYGLDEEEQEIKGQSSDDDFEVEADVNGAKSYFEPQPDIDPENAEGLIDFEDVIRADIVVNRKKIDYDNLIEKSEIKLAQPKRRGRKPKTKTEDEETTNYVCEPDLDSLSHLENQDSNGKNEDNEVVDEKKEPPEIDFCESQGVSEGDVLEKVEDETDPLGLKTPNSIETVLLRPPPIQEEEKIEEEDDDVIILGELKQDVIVLDD